MSEFLNSTSKDTIMKPLTKEQERVFTFLVEYKQAKGFPPTVREMSQALGYKSMNNSRQHLKLLAKKGYVNILKGKARGIEILVDTGNDISSTEIQVPLIGAVAAGTPIVAEQNVEAHITLDKNLFRGTNLFTLRINGDSMINIGVFHNDIVVIQPQTMIKDNDVVVALIDGEATLKRYIKEKKHIILRAENELYQDIIIPEGSDISIAGKLVGVVRKY